MTTDLWRLVCALVLRRTVTLSHALADVGVHHVPELNQLLLPFMSLVTTAAPDRNPTVKDEIRAAGLR